MKHTYNRRNFVNRFCEVKAETVILNANAKEALISRITTYANSYSTETWRHGIHVTDVSFIRNPKIVSFRHCFPVESDLN